MPSTRSSTRSRSLAASHSRPRRDTTIPHARLGDHLPAPLSKLTQYAHIPLFDTEEWVNRDTATRHAEVGAKDRKGRPRHVGRPHNAFMLYRRAYQRRIRAFCDEHANFSQRGVSAVAGASWHREPPAVRRRFVEWADREKEAHRAAWPEYKFHPRPPKEEVEISAPGDTDSEEEDWPVAGDGVATRVARGNGVNLLGADLDTPVPTAVRPHSSFPEQQQSWQQLPVNLTLGVFLSLQRGLQQQAMAMHQPVLCARCACAVTPYNGATNQAATTPGRPSYTRDSPREGGSNVSAELTAPRGPVPSAVPKLAANYPIDGLPRFYPIDGLPRINPIDGLPRNPLA